KQYRSIETIFRRDTNTKKLDTGKLRQLHHDTIRTWILTEKGDGTNIRVIYRPDGMVIKGRTDRAQLHPDLLAAIESTMPSWEQVNEVFGLGTARTVTFYGEGYGAGIQKKGSQYRPDKGFILFDIRITNDEH